MPGRRSQEGALGSELPARLTRFASPDSWAVRLPALLVGALQLPLVVSAAVFGLDLVIRVFYGYGFFGEGGGRSFFAAAAAPALLLDLLYLLGRLEVVSALPDPTVREAPPPPVLALPGGDDKALRPADLPPRALVGRRQADGVLFAAGVAMLALTLGMALVQQESFDSVLGIKLGGIWFRGTYWNRWWFVFYGMGALGASTVTAAMALFIRRLNRRDE